MWDLHIYPQVTTALPVTNVWSHFHHYCFRSLLSVFYFLHNSGRFDEGVLHVFNKILKTAPHISVYVQIIFVLEKHTVLSYRESLSLLLSDISVSGCSWSQRLRTPTAQTQVFKPKIIFVLPL